MTSQSVGAFMKRCVSALSAGVKEASVETLHLRDFSSTSKPQRIASKCWEVIDERVLRGTEWVLINAGQIISSHIV